MITVLVISFVRLKTRVECVFSALAQINPTAIWITKTVKPICVHVFQCYARQSELGSCAELTNRVLNAKQMLIARML